MKKISGSYPSIGYHRGISSYRTKILTALFATYKKQVVENEQTHYNNLLMQNTLRVFNEVIRSKERKHGIAALEMYFRGSYWEGQPKNNLFWTYLEYDLLKKEPQKVDTIGNGFTAYVNKLSGSKKRSGMWDYEKIYEYLLSHNL